MTAARRDRRKLIVSSVAAVLFLWLVAPTIAVPSQSAKLNGHCGIATRAGLSTIFVIDGPSNNPVEGVTVTAAGTSQVTNSSGIAVIRGGNFTEFAVSVSHEWSSESLAGHKSPLVCSGASYYRVLWLNLTGEEVQTSWKNM